MGTTYTSLPHLGKHPDIANALGNMVVVWANAETSLLSALARVSGMSLNMALAGYYRIPTFEARAKFILALVAEWKTDEASKEAMSTAVEKLAKLASTRNHWFHGDWSISDDPKADVVIFDQRAVPESPQRRKPVKANDIIQHCVAVAKRTADVNELADLGSLPI